MKVLVPAQAMLQDPVQFGVARLPAQLLRAQRATSPGISGGATWASSPIDGLGRIDHLLHRIARAIAEVEHMLAAIGGSFCSPNTWASARSATWM